MTLNESGCGAVGSALPWGGRGRWFKSSHSDQESEDDKSSDFLYFTRVFRTFRVRIFCFLRHSKMNEKTRKIGLVQDLVQEFKKCISKKSRGRVKIWNFERKNSMANITPKGNGTYLIRISCGSDSSGKPITKSKIFKPSKPKLSYQKLNKEIEAFIKAFEEEIETYGIQERPDKIRFAEFCEKYLDIKKSSLSPITYAFYEKIIREELIPMFGTIRMKEFRTYHVRKLYNENGQMSRKLNTLF